MRTGEYRVVSNGARFFVQELYTYCFLWWRWERWKSFGFYSCGAGTNIWVCRSFDAAQKANAWLQEMKARVQVARDTAPHSLTPVDTREINDTV